MGGKGRNRGVIESCAGPHMWKGRYRADSLSTSHFQQCDGTWTRRSDRAARSHSQQATADSITDSSNRRTGAIHRYCSRRRSASFEVTSSAVTRNSVHLNWATSCNQRT